MRSISYLLHLQIFFEKFSVAKKGLLINTTIVSVFTFLASNLLLFPNFEKFRFFKKSKIQIFSLEKPIFVWYWETLLFHLHSTANLLWFGHKKCSNFSNSKLMQLASKREKNERSECMIFYPYWNMAEIKNHWWLGAFRF